MEVKKFNKKHGFILIIFMIILITSVNTAIAKEDHNLTTSKDINKIQTNTIQQNTTSIQYQNNTQNKQGQTYKTKSTKQDNEYIEINENNKDKYQSYNFKENSQIIINGTVNNIILEISQQNITITGINNPTLRNSFINVYDDGCIHLSNLNFENDDNSESTIDICLETDKNTLENLTFNDYRQEIQDDLYRIIDITGNNNTIRTSTFNVTYPAMQKDWMYYGDDCKADVISVYGDDNIIEDNSFEVYEGEPKQYPFGLTRTLSIYGNRNILNRNHIYMNGTLYLYAITIFYHENIITNNYMEVHSIRYASGIALNGESSYNILKNNTIILITKNESQELFGLVDAAYGIVLTENAYRGGSYNIINSKMEGNIIEDNNIMGYSNHMYAFEQFGGKDTVIRNNNIDIEGRAPMGIAVIGSNTQIEGNIINVRGYTNQSEGSLDYLKPQTTGIYLFYGNGATITGNQITTDQGTTIRTLLESTTTITDNYLQVDNNAVTINILNPRGFTDIIGNIITDIENQIINRQNIYMEDNHDPNDIIPDNPDTPIENTTTNNTQNNTEDNIPDNTTTNTTDDNPLNNTTEPTNPQTNTNQTDLNNTIPEENNQTENITLPEETNQTENITVPEEINQTENITVPEEINQTKNITVPEEINQTENITVPEEVNQTENITLPEETNQTQNITIPEDINQTENITVPEEINETQNITVPEEVNQTENITLPDVVNETKNITVPEEVNQTENITNPEVVNKTENITIPEEINQTENITIPEEINQTENITIPEEINQTENITIPEEINQTIPVMPYEEIKQNTTLPSEDKNQSTNTTIPKENNTKVNENKNETTKQQETNNTLTDKPEEQQKQEDNNPKTDNTNQTVNNQEIEQTHNNQTKTENNNTNQTQDATIIIDDVNNTLENQTIENQTTTKENHTTTITDNIKETNQTVKIHNSTDKTNQTISAGDIPDINSPTDTIKPQQQINKVNNPPIESNHQEMENSETDNSQTDNSPRDTTDDTSKIDEVDSENPLIYNDNQDDQSNNHADNNPNELRVTQTLPDSEKVYELNQKQVMKLLDENIYAEIAFLVIMFLALLYGYISRNRIN